MSRLSAMSTLAAILMPLMLAHGVGAQERLPWERTDPYVGPAPSRPYDGTRQADPYRGGEGYRPYTAPRPSDPYRPGGANTTAAPNDAYVPPPNPPAYGESYRQDRYGDAYRPGPPGGYGTPYEPPSGTSREPYDRDYGRSSPQGPYAPPPRYDERADGTYSRNEILDTGHRFFGSISQGLAGAVEYAFKNAGRPNGYILGEDAGGAFVAGLRYGEGVLYTKDAGHHKVYWQGPSLGYDFGGEGSKTMVLVYNLRDPSDIYHRFGGVQGSAYLVGGVGVQFQKYGDVVLAPIRSGVGLRFGANVGYLKYTRTPTWNPF